MIPTAFPGGLPGRPLKSGYAHRPRLLPRKRSLPVSVLCQRRRSHVSPRAAFFHGSIYWPHNLPQVGLAGRLIAGCVSVPPPSPYRWAPRSPTSHYSTPCLTGYGRSTKSHGRTPRLHSPTAYRWARRLPHARGCTTTPPLLLVGGPEGRHSHASTTCPADYGRWSAGLRWILLLSCTCLAGGPADTCRTHR